MCAELTIHLCPVLSVYLKINDVYDIHSDWKYTTGSQTLLSQHLLNICVLCSRRSKRIRQLSVAAATDACPLVRSYFTLGNLPAELVRSIFSLTLDPSHIAPLRTTVTRASHSVAARTSQCDPQDNEENVQKHCTQVKGLPSRWTTSRSWCRVQSALRKMLPFLACILMYCRLKWLQTTIGLPLPCWIAQIWQWHVRLHNNIRCLHYILINLLALSTESHLNGSVSQLHARYGWVLGRQLAN